MPPVPIHTDFVVHAALQLSYSDPALLLLHLWVIVEYPVPQPGQVVHTQLILLPWEGGRERERKQRCLYQNRDVLQASSSLNNRAMFSLCGHVVVM